MQSDHLAFTCLLPFCLLILQECALPSTFLCSYVPPASCGEMKAEQAIILNHIYCSHYSVLKCLNEVWFGFLLVARTFVRQYSSLLVTVFERKGERGATGTLGKF